MHLDFLWYRYILLHLHLLLHMESKFRLLKWRDRHRRCQPLIHPSEGRDPLLQTHPHRLLHYVQSLLLLLHRSFLGQRSLIRLRHRMILRRQSLLILLQYQCTYRLFLRQLQ